MIEAGHVVSEVTEAVRAKVIEAVEKYGLQVRRGEREGRRHRAERRRPPEPDLPGHGRRIGSGSRLAPGDPRPGRNRRDRDLSPGHSAGSAPEDPLIADRLSDRSGKPSTLGHSRGREEDSADGRRRDRRRPRALAAALRRAPASGTPTSPRCPASRSTRSTGRRRAPTYPGFERIGWPGEFPFTRGLYPTGYRGRAWTIRQFAGFGNAQQTNERYKMILGRGRRRAVGRLRHADADGPRLRRPAGRSARSATAASRSTPPPTWTCSSTASRSADVTTSMTITGPAVPVFCMYLVAAERQGVDIVASSTARCRPTSSRSTSRRRSGSSPPSRTCA